jgi:pimeloyl-ACP methyl ester carboxylesterase
MLPFAVLRIWGLAFCGWGTLGTGILLIWLASAPVTLLGNWFGTASTSNPQAAGESAVVQMPFGGAFQELQRRVLLVNGVTLVIFSMVGCRPLLPLLCAKGSDGPRGRAAPATHSINRPDGSQLRVEVCGKSQGTTTLLFTHDWGLDSRAWHYVKRELGETCRLVLWDLPGHGKSNGPSDSNYSVAKMAEGLEAVLTTAAENGPVILVGHGIGGMILQTFCRIFPQHLGTRVRVLVLVQTTYTNPLKTTAGASFWKKLEGPVFIPFSYLTIWLSPLARLANLQSYLNGSLHLATRWSSFTGAQTWKELDFAAWLAATASPGIGARGHLQMLAFHERNTLPKIQIPVLVVVADHDRMTSPETADAFDQQLRHCYVRTLSSTGHFGIWERHARFAGLLKEFVRKIAPNALPPVDSIGGDKR